MLLSTLQKSGRRFNDAEVALLKSSVVAAEKALESQNNGKAAGELSKLVKLGPLGELKSYSELAVKANEFTGIVCESFDAMLDEAVTDLERDETACAGALVLADADRQYAGFKTLHRKVEAALKTAKRNGDLRPHLAQAQALAQARTLAESERASLRRKAPGAYRAVSRRYPDTDADKIAQTELEAISSSTKKP